MPAGSRVSFGAGERQRVDATIVPAASAAASAVTVVEVLAGLAVVVGIEVVDVVSRAAPVGLEVGLGLGLRREVGTVLVARPGPAPPGRPTAPAQAPR